MARPHAVRDEPRFVRLWLDLDVRARDIMGEFGICWDSVNRTARRLGLPMRADLRQEAGMNRHGPMRKYQPRTKTGRGIVQEPKPTTWRCPWCLGVSSDPEGHSACIMRHGGRAA